MNTGIQDMVNLGWKLALVAKGGAPAALLDTYEQERLPVMRDVLFKTESLTGLIGSENPIVRGLVNHLGPLIGGAGFVQESSAARMSQIAVGYRGGPLSEEHAHSGGLRAGDRVPDLRIRLQAGDAWEEDSLFGALDPLRFVLLVAHGETAAALDPGLRDAAAGWGDLVRLIELASPAETADSAKYKAALGHGSSIFLVRPDGYVGLAASEKAAAHELTAYRDKWITPA